MKTEYLNLTLINSTVLDIYVRPANNRHLKEESFQMEKLNLTWEVVKYVGKEL